MIEVPGLELSVEDTDGSFVYLESPLLNGMTVELIRAAEA